MRISDWSSDVCSSDLNHVAPAAPSNSVNAVDPNVIGVATNIPNFWFENDTSEQTSKITNISGQNSPNIRITLSFSTNSHLHAAHCNPKSKKDRKSTRMNSSHYCPSRMQSSA